MNCSEHRKCSDFGMKLVWNIFSLQRNSSFSTLPEGFIRFRLCFRFVTGNEILHFPRLHHIYIIGTYFFHIQSFTISFNITWFSEMNVPVNNILRSENKSRRTKKKSFLYNLHLVLTCRNNFSWLGRFCGWLHNTFITKFCCTGIRQSPVKWQRWKIIKLPSVTISHRYQYI